MVSKKDLWRSYNDIAHTYREMSPAADAIGEALVEYAAPAAGARLLDVGAGRGAVAQAAVARGCQVTAVDAAPRMVELLAADLPQARVHLMDASALELADSTFDVVTGGYLLDVLPDPAAAVAELHRVMEPGGTVALSEPCPVRPRLEWLHELAADFWSRPSTEQAAAERTAALERVEQLLRDAGFTGLTTDGWERQIPFSSPGRMWDYLSNKGVGEALEVLASPEREEFKKRFLKGAQEMQSAHGLALDQDAVLFRARKP